jgi:hypothetical protein
VMAITVLRFLLAMDAIERVREREMIADAASHHTSVRFPRLRRGDLRSRRRAP